MNSTLTLISGLGLRPGLETSGLGLGLGLEALGLVNIPASNGLKRGEGTGCAVSLNLLIALAYIASR